MTREKALEKIWHIALDLQDNWSWDEYNKMWDIAIDFNKEHDDVVIFEL